MLKTGDAQRRRDRGDIRVAGDHADQARASAEARTVSITPGMSASARVRCTSRRPGLWRTDWGGPSPGAICGRSARHTRSRWRGRGSRGPGPRCDCPIFPSAATNLAMTRLPTASCLGRYHQGPSPPRRAAAPDPAQLHLREVLCLVKDDVPEARRALEQVDEFVEEHQVGGQASARCQGCVEASPSAADPARPARGSRRRLRREAAPPLNRACSTLAGSRLGHNAFEYALTAVLRATAS